MAQVISKTFDLPHGAIVIRVQDALGVESVHTAYVTGPNPVADVQAWIAKVLADTDAAASALHAAFTAAGWDGN